MCWALNKEDVGMYIKVQINWSGYCTLQQYVTIMVDSIKCIRASKKDNWHAEFSIKRIRSFAKHLFCFHFCLFALAYLLLCLVSGYYISIKVQMPLDSRLLNKPKLAEIKTLIPYVYMCLGYYWAQRLVIWPLSLDIIASPTFNLCLGPNRV